MLHTDIWSEDGRMCSKYVTRIHNWYEWNKHVLSEHMFSCSCVSKSKAVPLRAMEALGGERYSSYSFTTSALDRGEWSASHPGRAFTPGERTCGTHCTGCWVGPEPVWTQRLEEKCFAPAGNRTPIVQPVVRHYTDWATRLLVVVVCRR
jgi:hypothetical protein